MPHFTILRSLKKFKICNLKKSKIDTTHDWNLVSWQLLWWMQFENKYLEVLKPTDYQAKAGSQRMKY
jgi:hypothetical protein